MNKMLTAAAVSAVTAWAVGYSAIASADPEFQFYGRVSNQIILLDEKDAGEAGVSTTDIDTNGSRIGVNATSEIGNGLTVNGQYEWATTSDTNGQAFNQTRFAWVSLQGAFGEVKAGQLGSAYYGGVGGMVEPFYNASPPSLVGGATGATRTGSTLQYNNSFGSVSFGFDIRADDDADGARDAQGDGFGLGLSIKPASNIEIGFGYDIADGMTSGDNSPDDPDTTAYGVAVKGTFGNFWGVLGSQNSEVDSVSALCVESSGDTTCNAGDTNYPAIESVETDYTQILVGTAISENANLTIGYGESTESQRGENDEETTGFSIGVDYLPGGGLVFFSEYNDQSVKEKGVAGEDEKSQWVFGMRFIF